MKEKFLNRIKELWSSKLVGQGRQFLKYLSDYFLWFLLFTVWLLVWASLGCATKPDVWRQENECIKIKAEGNLQIFLCLEVGGDGKIQKFK